MDDDATLLRRYAHTRDEAAFAALVHRHVDFVHSVAGRCVQGDADLARDVSQQVFLALARRAAALVGHPCLLGWLHTCACQRAADLVRSEARRRLRETTATTDPALAAEPPVPWENLAPVLDLALQTLGERDRETVLLRYFAQKPFADIAAALGTTEAAAQMRATRALEKLRRALAARGVTSTASALGLALGAHAVSAAPASVAASTLAALAASGTAATSAALLSFLTMSFLKHAATGLVCASLAGLAVYQFTSSPARAPSLAAPPLAPPTSASHLTVPASPSSPDPDPRLAALAAENAALRARLAAAETDSASTRDKLAELRRPMTADLISSTLRATVQPGETVVTGGSVMPNGKRIFAFATPVQDHYQGQEVVKIGTRFIALADDDAKAIGLDQLATSAANTLQHGEVWANGEMDAAFETMQTFKNANVLSLPTVFVVPGREASVNFAQDAGEMLQLKVTPSLAPDGKGIEM